MATKTITVTENAYEALKAKKEERESFSETILRITKKRSIWDFYGVLRGEPGERLEKAIRELRQIRAEANKNRLAHLRRKWEG